MIRRPPRSTRTDTLFPYTTLFRSLQLHCKPRVIIAPALRSDEADLSLRGRQRVVPQQSFHPARSEEHTSELQSLMRISYAVFCLKKKKQEKNLTTVGITIHIISISL